MTSRFDILHEIETLDPEADNQRIVYLVGSYEYPWLMQRALEFALFRTFAVARTSRLLVDTGEFTQRGQRRYDDTTLMISEMAEHGYESERGRAAIKQMNRMHRRYDIANEDYLYVLSTFIFEPVRWHERYGWRKPTRTEKLANYHFWCEVGRRMNLKDIPPTYKAFEAFNIQHERENFAYHPVNRRLAEATMQVFLNWYPAPLRPIIREILIAFMDDPLREAFAFPKPHSVVRWGAHLGLKLAGKLMRFMPPRKRPFSYTQRRNRSYPFGYRIDRLGPPGAL